MLEPKTAVQELEALKLTLAEKDTVLADLQKKSADDKAALDAAIAAGADLQAKVGDLTKQVADVGAKLAKAEGDCAAAVKLAEEQQARADKAEKKLALDPDHIDVSGRTKPVTENAAAGVEQSLEEFQKAYEAEPDPAKRTAMWRERFDKKS